MSHLLILGGSGFFGKSILDAYRRGLLEDFDIDKISILSRRARDLQNTHSNLIDSSIDLIDDDLLTCRVLPKAHIVIHAAASTDAARYALYPEDEERNVLLAVSHFCGLARTYCQDSKIVFVSSGAIYGQYSSDIEYVDEEYDFKILDKVEKSKYVYTKAKRECETLIQELGLGGIDVSIARCFAFVGKYLPRDQHFAIGNFIRDGLTRQSVVVKASSRVYRSYMHSDDLAYWLIKIATIATQDTPIYNVGSDEAISIQDLGKKIALYFGVDATISPIINPHIDRYVPCVNKAKIKLGLSLRYSLDQAINASIQAIKAS